MPITELERIAASQSSVSDKIRALDRAGVSRADIARVLDKRYQHVRNVLEADKAKAREPLKHRRDVPLLPGSNGPLSSHSSPASETGPISRLVPADDGSLIIPSNLLAAFGSRPGEVVIAVVRQGELTLRTPGAAISHAQDLVRRLIDGNDSLADSLVADRRREAGRETASG